MTLEQKQEVIDFLSKTDTNQTLHSLTFSILCFSYDTEKNKKSWLNYEQGDNAPFEAIWVLGNNDYRFHGLQTVKEVLSQLTTK